MAATDTSAKQAKDVFKSCAIIIAELLKHPEAHLPKSINISFLESPLNLSGIHERLLHQAYRSAQHVKDDVKILLEYWKTRHAEDGSISTSGEVIAQDFNRLWAQHGIDDAWRHYETVSWQEHVRGTT